jgi:hypothetical protein
MLPSIDPIFGSGIPQARIATQHSNRLSGSALGGPSLHCLILCNPFATYRGVTHSPASTICRCITVPVCVGVRMCVAVAPAQHSASFTGAEGRAEFILRRGEYTRHAHGLGGNCMGETLLLLSCGAAFLTGLGIAS